MIPLRTGILGPGDDLAAAVASAARRSGRPVEVGDVVVVSSKAVSAVEGRYADLSEVRPGGRARDLAVETGLAPEFCQLVLDEADEVLGAVRWAILTLKRGIMVPNAGVDLKNAPAGMASLWPEDPDGSARRVARGIEGAEGVRVGVVVADSYLLPLRRGTVSVAIGSWGVRPLLDLRGRTDLFGRRIGITQLDLLDSLASAAHLVIGEGGEGAPAALVRGMDALGPGSVGDLSVPWGECAVAGALRPRRRP